MNMNILTLYIDFYNNCCRNPYSVPCGTAVWPWHDSLNGRRNGITGILIQNFRPVNFDPFPNDTGVWVCSSQCTLHCSWCSLRNSVWTRCNWLNFWFICQHTLTIVNKVFFIQSFNRIMKKRSIFRYVIAHSFLQILCNCFTTYCSRYINIQCSNYLNICHLAVKRCC